ncbi:MAG: hypothetical protein HQL76_12525 [Magnetococcales bacterium]|nr:hypothetical protein [Magnetococcales bacterium]
MATFIRRFLKLRGWRQHDFRAEIAPTGRGSGEQWVRERFPDELEAQRAHGSNTVLVVGTDADTKSVADRIATLDRACRERKVQPKTLQDTVVMVVPKRNIETWFAYLRGETTNEDEEYRRYDNESDCRNDVRSLDEMCRRKELHNPAPPSLQMACREYQRMPHKNA